jgi:2-polyprenyl-3-methyl-5-hydroxy-6-metoxy-1,4-benzoquinol methylase
MHKTNGNTITLADPDLTTGTDGQDCLRSICDGCGARGIAWRTGVDRFHGRQHQYRLLRCPSCGLVWIGNPPGPEEMGPHYSTVYDRAVTTAGECLDRFEWRRQQLARYKAHGSVLDIGCSAGSFLYCMRRSGWQVYGIEMSRSAADTARERSGAKVFNGDISAAVFDPGQFDVITAFHVLEHAYSPREMLYRVSRWLKPGGIYYMMVPNIDSGGFKTFGSYWFALELPRHLFHFCPESLTRMADSVGLEMLDVKLYREPFIENSTRYLIDAGLTSLGISRRPLAMCEPPGLMKRIVRKALRNTIVPFLSVPMRLAGPGESIHAFFQKPV